MINIHSIACRSLLLFVLLCLPVTAVSADFSPQLHAKWITQLKKEKFINRRPCQFATPLIHEGVVYVGTASGRFYALDGKKGKKLWQTQLEGSVYSEPAIEGGTVYVADRKGIVYSLNKDTGAIIWQSEVGAEISSKPLIVGDIVYVATVLKQLAALDKENGGKKWQTAREGIIPSMTVKLSSSPIYYDGVIYAGYADGTLVSYKPQDGTILWKKQLADKSASFTDVDATPLISNGVLYISSADGRTYAISVTDGKVLWRADKGGVNDPVLHEGNLYVASGGVLSCLAADTGRVLWEQDLGLTDLSTPVVADGFVITVATKNKVYVVDRASGEFIYARFLGKGAFGKPVVDGNTLYILSNSSKLFALQGGGK